MESSAKRYSRVIRSRDVIGDDVGPPTNLRGSGDGSALAWAAGVRAGTGLAGGAAFCAPTYDAVRDTAAASKRVGVRIVTSEL
jgi:hypothetical protein